VDKFKKLNLGLITASLITLVSLAGCLPAGEAEGGGNLSIFIFFIVAMFAVMYIFTIRPQRRKRKEHEELVANLRKGDKVITAGGIYGQIENINDENIVLKIESGATIRVARNSITSKRSK